ncbi:MAG: hypothetical protein WBA17_03265 [Saprospiraceae bacterium]
MPESGGSGRLMSLTAAADLVCLRLFGIPWREGKDGELIVTAKENRQSIPVNFSTPYPRQSLKKVDNFFCRLNQVALIY